jgi:threonine/homoserine/homoserine lactone efflux protein
MKVSDGFDARRLRPKGPGSWGVRIGSAIAALLATFGVLLTMAGVSSLIGRPQVLGELNASPLGAALVVAGGLLLLYIGIWLWRRCRLSKRRKSGLNMSPHLMKKHD